MAEADPFKDFDWQESQDTRRLDDLFEQLRGMAVRQALGAKLRYHDAEDVAHEACMKLWHYGRRTFDPDRRLKAFFSQIVANAIWDRIKGEGKHKHAKTDW